jgi:hypothetical protein
MCFGLTTRSGTTTAAGAITAGQLKRTAPTRPSGGGATADSHFSGFVTVNCAEHESQAHTSSLSVFATMRTPVDWQRGHTTSRSDIATSYPEQLMQAGRTLVRE